MSGDAWTDVLDDGDVENVCECECESECECVCPFPLDAHPFDEAVEVRRWCWWWWLWIAAAGPRPGDASGGRGCACPGRGGRGTDPGGGVNTGRRSSFETSIPSSETKDAADARRASERLSARTEVGRDGKLGDAESSPAAGVPGVYGVAGVPGAGMPGVDGVDGGRSEPGNESGARSSPRACVRDEGTSAGGGRVIAVGSVDVAAVVLASTDDWRLLALVAAAWSVGFVGFLPPAPSARSGIVLSPAAGEVMGFVAWVESGSRSVDIESAVESRFI